MTDKTAEERAAEIIYGLLQYDGPGAKPEWVPGGNSIKQDEARAVATVIIREGEDAAYERAATAVRAECAVCMGTGYASADEECPYCGYPLQAILALKHGDA